MNPIKHSLTINGHATSITLEPEFWAELKALARREQTSLATLVASVDAARGDQNLSSALRVYVLRSIKEKTVFPA
jgi:predicted DNA-binding ribbon-helix-helix protein